MGLLFSFSIQEYLFKGENQSGSEQFIVSGSSYEIIYVNGSEALLLRNGALVQNEPEIADAIREYYLDTYYPKQSRINNITTLLGLYHESRENGDMWEGVEEEECRMSLLLHAFPCTNSSVPTTFSEAVANDCYLTASVLCDEYGDSLGCTDPLNIISIVQDFALSSNGMAQIQNQTEADLGNLTEDNVYEVFSELRDNIAAMRDYESKLENTIFRVPMGGASECPGCVGMCPPIIISGEYLDMAEEEVDYILPRVQYIGEYESMAWEIYNSTSLREAYRQGNAQKIAYMSLFAPEKARAEDALSEAEALLEYVSDDVVLTSSQRVAELLPDIEGNISEGNFGQINASRSELNAKVNVLLSAINSSWSVYNSTLAAKEQADALFFTLETKELSDEALAHFADLKAQKRTQDRSFVTGLSPEKYSQIAGKYDELNSEAASLVLEGQYTAQVVDSFKGAGMKTNEGIASLAATMAPLPRQEREEFSGYAPLVVSSLSFFSLSSLAIFLFLFAFATFARVFRSRLVLFAGILLIGCAILFSGVVSGGIYFILSSSSNSASFSDFQSSVLSSSQVSILVETENVPSGAASKMMECAESLASYLEGNNVTIYERTNSECLINGQDITLAECYNTIDEPIIALQYSMVEEAPQFMTGFVYKGTFRGDEEYFSECQLAKGFVRTDISSYLEADDSSPAQEPGDGSAQEEDGGTQEAPEE